MEENIYRAAAALALIASLGVSGFHRRRARRAMGAVRRGAEPAGVKALRVGFGVPLYLSVLVYLVRPSGVAWAVVPVPMVLRWVGLALLPVAVALVVWVMRHLDESVTPTIYTGAGHRLVTDGPYRWVRHPLYSVGFLLFGSIGLVASNALILGVMVAGAVAWGLWIIPREEAELEGTFGESYARYRARTGRLVPWPVSRRRARPDVR